MSERVLKDCRIYHGGYDLSGRESEIVLAYGAEIKDRTAGATTARQKLAGLTAVEVSGGGYWDPQVNDAALFEGLALDAQVLTVVPASGAPGSLAYTMRAADGEYSPSGAVGDLIGYDFAAYGIGALVRGVVMESATLDASGAGTPRELPAVPEGKALHAALHVLGVEGTGAPGVTVTIESSAANTWDGSETVRVEFDAALAPGAQWAALPGPVTDTWWRVSWTVTGTEPGIRVVVVLGIK